MPMPVTRYQQRFSLNLAEAQAVSQRNYARLLRLFPVWKTQDRHQLLLPDNTAVSLQVAQRDRYSSVFRLTQAGTSALLAGIDCSLRLYHDAGLVDVLEWGGLRRFKARYNYPNAAMYARDEKWQQQRFLGEWLNFCLRHGRSTVDEQLPELFS